MSFSERTQTVRNIFDITTYRTALLPLYKRLQSNKQKLSNSPFISSIVNQQETSEASTERIEIFAGRIDD